MSAEEDLELRDLVTQALESNGVLSKIRAELRASVFLALEEQDLLQSENSFANKSFRNFIKTSEGMLLTQLVREFLEFFQLDFTLSVFDPETSFGKDYDYLGRNALLKDLGVKNFNGDSEPLLAQIFKVVSKKNVSENQNVTFRARKESQEINDSTTLLDVSQDKVIHQNVKNAQSLSHPDNTHKALLEHPPKVSESPNETYLLSSSVKEDKTDEPGDEKEISKLFSENTDKKKEVSFGKTSTSAKNINDLTSLSNLPPLSSSNKYKADMLPPVSQGKRDINRLKTMINSLDVAESNYEEDFQSSASGSGVEGRSAKNSLPGSESEEIEEDIGSGIDDLLSNASGLEDLTVDATVSNVSGLGDYMETV